MNAPAVPVRDRSGSSASEAPDGGARFDKLPRDNPVLYSVGTLGSLAYRFFGLYYVVYLASHQMQFIYKAGVEHQWVAFIPSQRIFSISSYLMILTYFGLWPLIRLSSLYWQRWIRPAAAGLVHWYTAPSPAVPGGRLTVRLSSYYAWQPIACMVLFVGPAVLFFTPWFEPTAQYRLVPDDGILFIADVCAMIMWVWAFGFFSACIGRGWCDLIADFGAGTLSIPRGYKAPNIVPLESVAGFDAVYDTCSQKLVAILHNGDRLDIMTFDHNSTMDILRIKSLTDWLNSRLLHVSDPALPLPRSGEPARIPSA